MAGAKREPTTAPPRPSRGRRRFWRVVSSTIVLVAGAAYVGWSIDHDATRRDAEHVRAARATATALAPKLDALTPDVGEGFRSERLVRYLRTSLLLDPTWKAVTLYGLDGGATFVVAQARTARATAAPHPPPGLETAVAAQFDAPHPRLHRGGGGATVAIAPIADATLGHVVAVLAVDVETNGYESVRLAAVLPPLALTIATLLLLLVSFGAAPLWVALALTAAITHVAFVRDRAQDLAAFHALADEPLAYVDRTLTDLGRRELEALARFFLLTEEVTYQAFLDFVAGMGHESVVSLWTWIPTVRPPADDGGPVLVRDTTAVWAVGSEGEPMPVVAEAVHYPVGYAAPRARNASLDGFDLASESRPREALEVAATTGRTTASEPLHLAHDPAGPTVALVARPVLRIGAAPIEGFVAFAVPFDALLSAAVRRESEAAVLTTLRLEHVESDGNLVPLAVGGPQAIDAPRLVTRRPLFVFGQSFVITAQATEAFGVLNARRTPWWTLLLGSLVSASVGTGLWLTRDRHVALERQVAGRTAELRESESRFRAFAEAAPLGILLVDAQERVHYVNRAFVDLYGFTAAELPDVSTWLQRTAPDPTDRDAVGSVLRAALDETRATRSAAHPVEIVVTCRDGRVRVVECHAATIGSLDAVLMQDVSDRKAAEAKLARIAHYDVLTGVPNRRLLADRLRQAIAHADRTGRPLAVSMLDLDGFKAVNDRYGHHVGDELLVEVARRLRGVVRAEDTVARLGGDEFVLLAGDLEGPEEGGRLAERVLRALDRPLDVHGHVLRVGASVGVTLYPADDVDGETLLRHADQMMYRAKTAGRGRSMVFDPEHRPETGRVRERASRVADGLARGEFTLHYQPQVDLRTGEVLGFEALARWQHPERGLLGPTEFLPHVLRGALATEFGTWSIDTALDQMQRWRREGIPFIAGVTVAVNVASAFLGHDVLLPWLRRRMDEHRSHDAGALQLEIVEAMAIDDARRLATVMARCRELGVRFALDDFGTGYATLVNVRALPVDRLKIDQTFVRGMLDDPEDLSIVENVLQLGVALGREVVAEGVESLEHAALWRRLGGRSAQGHAAGPPLPPAAVPGWLAAWREGASWRTLDDAYARFEAVALQDVVRLHAAWYDAVHEELRHPETAVSAAFGRDGCAFGRWYRGRGRIRYGHAPSYAALGEHHDHVHVVGDGLLAALDLADREARSDGAARFHELERAESAFQGALRDLTDVAEPREP